MLKPIKLRETEDLPLVILDAENEIFRVTGRVLPEDGNVFFEPILKWIASYVEKPNKSTEFFFQLDYYNSSTARMLAKMIAELEHILTTGNDVKVIWLYNEDDEVIEERGEELKSISDLPFEMRVI